MSAVDLVGYVARSLVDDPDSVSVEEHDEGEGKVIELHVAETDMGKVIGRNGSVAKALSPTMTCVISRTPIGISTN